MWFDGGGGGATLFLGRSTVALPIAWSSQIMITNELERARARWLACGIGAMQLTRESCQQFGL